MSFIVSQSKQIMGNAIERYAKKWNTPPQTMQLMFKLQGDDAVAYYLLKDFKMESELSIMDILGVKIDFKGYSLIAPAFIRKSMERIVQQYKITDPNFLSVMVVKRPEIKMYAYNQKASIGEITFEYLFGEDMK